MKPDELTNDELKKMLALKRHEQPPPTFFRSLSGSVINRLQSPEPLLKPTWRQRLSLDSDGLPLYVCVAGIAVCGLLTIGLIWSLRVEPSSPQPVLNADQQPLVSVPPGHPLSAPIPQMAPVVNAEETPPSFAPVLAPQSSPFNQLTIRPNQATLHTPAVASPANAKSDTGK